MMPQTRIVNDRHRRVGHQFVWDPGLVAAGQFGQGWSCPKWTPPKHEKILTAGRGLFRKGANGEELNKVESRIRSNCWPSMIDRSCIKAVGRTQPCLWRSQCGRVVALSWGLLSA